MYEKKRQVLQLFFLISCFVFSISVFSKKALAVTLYEEGVICEGIEVNGVELSGKTEKEARTLLKDRLKDIKTKKAIIEIYREGDFEKTEEPSLAEVGVTSVDEKKVDEIMAEVMMIGRKGNLITRYKDLKDAEEKEGDYKISFSYDEAKLKSFIEEFAEKYEIKPEDASLKRVNGTFVLEDGKIGQTLNKHNLENNLKTSLDENIQSYVMEKELRLAVKADIEVMKPKYTKEDLSMVTDLLGTYTTSYGGGAGGRIQNIQNGCKHINGSVLLPGEVLSANKKMYPYTIANGYATGGAFLNGKVVQDIGGGICQVSTTLYNAVLYSELEVVERQNHSMTVAYVPLARDAAIAGDYKDFVFKNNSKYPIYVEGITGGGKITFNIYGHETRDMANRKVDFETLTLKTIYPEKDIVKKDDTKPEDYEEVIQGAWIGYKTELYKVVKVNGRETERKLVNISNYRSNPRYVVRGTKKVEKDKEEEKKSKKGKKKKTPKEEVNEEDDEIEEVEEIVEDEEVDE